MYFLNVKKSGIGKPSIFHALVIIFLEYFAWSLLTLPVISVSNMTIINGHKCNLVDANVHFSNKF